MTLTLDVAHPEFGFEAAHFFTYADGRRDPMHGHSFNVAYRLEGVADVDGLLVDFNAATEAGKALGRALDHRTLFAEGNADLAIEKADLEIRVTHTPTGARVAVPSDDVVTLPVRNITAEELARYLAGRLLETLAAPTVHAITATVEEGNGFSASFRATR